MCEPQGSLFQGRLRIKKDGPSLNISHTVLEQVGSAEAARGRSCDGDCGAIRVELREPSPWPTFYLPQLPQVGHPTAPLRERRGTEGSLIDFLTCVRPRIRQESKTNLPLRSAVEHSLGMANWARSKNMICER